MCGSAEEEGSALCWPGVGAGSVAARRRLRAGLQLEAALRPVRAAADVLASCGGMEEREVVRA